MIKKIHREIIYSILYTNGRDIYNGIGWQNFRVSLVMIPNAFLLHLQNTSAGAEVHLSNNN